MSWIILLIAGLLEVVWAVGLKYTHGFSRLTPSIITITAGTVAKLAMRQPFVLFKGLTFQKLCLPGAFRPGDHHNKMLRPG
ncbi:SMR family transporter, partial [Salmonella enterica]